MDRERSPQPPSRSVRITDRDRLLLAFAAEHRFVLASHVGVLLGISADAASARLRALTAAGYVRAERKLNAEPATYQVTREGLRAIGSDLPGPSKVDLATYRHEAGVAWLTVAARGELFGPMREVISERRMRSHDGRADGRAPPLGIRLGGVGPGGRDRLHYPDMVLVTATGHRVAFELELSPKGRNRREGILAAYAADPRIDVVVYLVDSPRLRQAINRSAARLGISSLIRVHNVQDAETKGASRARARVPSRRRGADAQIDDGGRAMAAGRAR